MRLGRGLLLLIVPFALLGAQGARPVGGGAAVSGVVWDSLSRVPLAGAVVQLAAADSGVVFGRTAISDPHGRFAFDGVPDGRYVLGFLHALLDSLGIVAPAREVVVKRRGNVRADLAIPPPARLRVEICGESSDSTAGGVVTGVVRDALGREPLAGVTVAGEWLELALTRGGAVRRVPRMVATTEANGLFALCGVPRPGMVALVAARGGDSTDVIEVPVPREGFVHRDINVGTSGAAHAGRITGTVHAADGSGPIPGALVRLAGGGVPTRTNSRGEFSLAGLPVGTRALEVRSIGYFPARVAVDVVEGAAPVFVTLPSIRAMLDTVMVRAQLLDPLRSGFEERRRTGQGRYVSEEYIARRRPIVATDLLRSVQALYLERNMSGELELMMRGTFADRCSPSIYINGQYMGGLTASELDLFLPPERIAGIEVYSGTIVPPQFSPGLSGCGSIVFWTKRLP